MILEYASNETPVLGMIFYPNNGKFVNSVFLGILIQFHFSEESLFSDILPRKGRIILVMVSNHIGLISLLLKPKSNQKASAHLRWLFARAPAHG